MENENWIDWNELSMEEMVHHLKTKHAFSSSGESLCIFKLIEFWEDNKDEIYKWRKSNEQ